MTQPSGSRVTALIEASPEEPDAARLRTAWEQADPFAALAGDGVHRYVRGIGVTTDLAGFRSRRRVGAAHFWTSDDDAANALAGRLNSGAVTAGSALDEAQVSAVPFRAHVIFGSAEELAPGVKAVYLVKGRDGMTTTEFHDYWRTIHGPLVVGQPGIDRYSQGHRLLSSYGPVDSPYDGVTEISYADEAAVLFSTQQPHVARQAADTPHVFDMAVGIRVLTREQPIF
jgi:uncharacterized protein (TIGR02118 family)